MEKQDKILEHTIKYWFDDDLDILFDTDIDHIKEQIEEGYTSGELCHITGKYEERRGWWRIDNEKPVSRERALAIAERIMEVMTFQRTVEGNYLTDWGLKRKEGVIESLITIITEG